MNGGMQPSTMARRRDVWALLSAEPMAWPLRALAARFGIGKSTMQRDLDYLIGTGYLARPAKGCHGFRVLIPLQRIGEG